MTTAWINFAWILTIVGVLTGSTEALPRPDVSHLEVSPDGDKYPFSLDLLPPLPDNSNGANKPVLLPLRDSYGNPIPPSVLGVDPSGVDYGLSRPIGNNVNVQHRQNVQGINFPIPSYASGITEIHRPSDGLLPPFDSTKSTSQDVQPSVSSSLPTSQSSFSSSGLIPPEPVILGTQKDDEINEISGTLTYNSPIPDSPSTTPIAFTTTVPSIPSISTESSKTTTEEVGVKYTGGFGGAPGILGEQKEIGSRVKLSTTTKALSTTISTTTTTTTQLPVITARIDLSSNFDRTPIGVEPPSSIISPNDGVPTISKVLLPPFEPPKQVLHDSDISKPINPPKNEPEIIRTPLLSNPLTVEIPIKEPVQQSLPVTISDSIPPPSRDLLPPPYSSNSKPFQPPPITKPTTTTTTTTIAPLQTDSSVLPQFSNTAGTKPSDQSTFLSIPFGFTNQSPIQLKANQSSKSSQRTAIGKALQERFGTNFNVQQLPNIVNSLEQSFKSTGSPSLVPDAYNKTPVSIDNRQAKSEGDEILTVPDGPAVEAVPSTPQAPPTLPSAPQAPILVAPHSANVPKVTASNSGKYTGGFGGAPGILGEQKEVGFLVKEQQGDGGNNAPTATVPAKIPTPPADVPAASQNLKGKYTGGFGGPPGVLIPFDNGSKSA